MAITASQIGTSNTLEQFRVEFNNLQTDLSGLESGTLSYTALSATTISVSELTVTSSLSAESFIFEGATNDDFETTLTVTDPTADRTITLPNVTGTVSLITATETLTNKTLTTPTIATPNITGTAVMADLDISGDVDIDGTLEADAITIDGTTLAETISDTVGAMVGSNTETGISVTYEDGDNTLDFVLGATQTTITSLTNASLVVGRDADNDIDFATDNNILFRAAGADQIKLIDGVLAPVTDNDIDLGTSSLEFKDAFFDGTVTSDAFAGPLTGDVTGNADTATALATARTIGGTSFDGTANIAVALSATATALATARTIGGVSFDGTGNINLPGVNTAGNQDTSGTAAIATTVTITDNESTNESNAIIFTAGGDVDGGNLGLESDGTLTYNPSTGKITATGFAGATGDFSGAVDVAGTTTAVAITASGLVTANADMLIGGATPTLTIGDAGAEDTKIVFDGNAQDFYIALDDSADDLLIGLGSTVGTTPAIAIDENLLVTTHGGITMVGTTPTLTIGDAGAEDTKIVFDGNAQDFYIGLDDSADDLLIGLGSAVGTTPAIAIDENLQITTGGDIVMGGTTPTLTIGDAGAEDAKIVFDGNAQDFHIGLDDSADDLVIGLGSALGTTPAISIDENLKIALGGAAVGKTNTANATGNTTLDFDANQNHVLTATGNITLVNPSTESVGQSGIICLIQDGTGSRTLTLGTDYETAGGAGITISTGANAVDIIPYFVKAANSIQLGAPQLAFA
jgi:hypothetical protein